jgi:membrane fusion protein, multidrug efflux system
MKRAIWVLMFLLAACGDGKAKLTQLPTAESASAAVPALDVRSAPVQRAEIERPVRAHGTSEPMRAADLGPQMTARVQSVLVQEGDRVVAGQPLVRLDTTEATLRTQQSAAQATSTETQYAQAKADYERLAPLAGKGSVTVQQIERLASQRDALKASLDMARVAQASAKRDLTNAIVRAPFAGIISRVWVEAGEVVTMMPVKVLARLIDLSSVDVRVHVHEAELSRIALGNPARARFPSSGAVSEGVITFISPEIDPRTRTAEVVARLANADGSLRAGMFAQIELRPNAAQQGLIIPTGAVAGTGEDRYVFRVVDGTAQRRKVRVAAIDATTQEVLEGLSESDLVVIEGLAQLSDGVRVAQTPKKAAGGDTQAKSTP